MRTWCLWLMMVLLPCRLWAADAMAMQLTAPTPPCHAAVSSETGGHPATGDNADAEPSAHALCNICHGTVAETHNPAAVALPPGTGTLPHTPPQPLHSVLRAPDLRPPIA